MPLNQINMQIRDAFSELDGDNSSSEIKTAQILHRGRVMYEISLNADGSLLVSGGGIVKFNGNYLGESLNIQPLTSNTMIVSKEKIVRT